MYGRDRNSARIPRITGAGPVCLFVFFFLLCHLLPPAAWTAPASVTPDDAGFDSISLEHGLSQSSARSILQDHVGFIWIGTEDGLNQYDGNSFTVYRYDPEDENSLCHDKINHILEDSKGAIWIGTENGLDRLDPSRRFFTHFRHDPENPATLSSSRIIEMIEDREGMLWIGAENGLNRLDPVTGTVVRYLPNADQQEDSGAPGGPFIQAFLEDREGTLWIGSTGGLDRYDPATDRFTHFRHDPDDPDTIRHPAVSSLCEDGEGVLWVGTFGGLHRFNRESGRFELFGGPGAADELSRQVIFSITEDSLGMLWVGTSGGGVYLIDKTAGTVRNYSRVPGDPRSLSWDIIFQILEDRSGLIWIATHGAGLNIFDRERKAFRHYTHVPGDPNSLHHVIVHALTEDREGNLWIGVAGGGLSKLDRKTDTITRYIPDPDDDGSIGSDQVWTLLTDRAGTLWIGTLGGGLERYDPASDSFVQYRNRPNDPTSLTLNGVYSLFEDHLGVLWVGTARGGLCRLDDPVSGSFTRFLNDADDPRSLSHNLVWALGEDAAGELWVGTEAGVNRFDRETETFTRFQHDPADPNSLSRDLVMSVFSDSHGVLWVGTGHGLNRFDPKTEKFRIYRVREGLPNNVIYATLEDDEGNLWLSTNKGLSRFTPDRDGRGLPVFRNFDMHDGLQSNEFNVGSRYRSESGEMFFGGINGFNSFHPDRINDNSFVPPVVITDIRVPGKRFEFDGPLSEVESITLNHHQNLFAVQFSALNFRQPGKNSYAYMLEGLDDDWTAAGTRRYASYTNLHPGEYMLRVRAANNDGIWNEEGASLRVIITPPFWQRWWFRIAAAAVSLGLIVAWYRRRVKFLAVRAELQTARETQMSILPQFPPSVKNLDIAGTCIPANTVGGDFYDYIWLDAERSVLGVAVGDVSGKSMKAALTAVLTNGLIQAEARKNSSVSGILGSVNIPLYLKTEKSMFTALCFVRLDTRSLEMTMTNAGLSDPLLRSGDTVTALLPGGSRLPLGVLEQNEYEELTVQLKCGDVLLLCTDGVTEAHDLEHEMYGAAALEKFLARMDTGTISARGLCDAVIDDVRRFTAGTPQDDDITIVAVKVL